jgi:hypothetical protein
VAQAFKCLPGKYKALSSNPSTAKKKKIIIIIIMKYWVPLEVLQISLVQSII